MTMITAIEQHNFNYIKNIRDSIDLGIQPIKFAAASIVLDRQFNARMFLQPNAAYNELRAIGILDANRKEHVIAFKNLKSFQACLNFVYGSSTVIPHRWYYAKA